MAPYPDPKKTAFIHFTRSSSKLACDSIWVKGSEIKSTDQVKILGVILDQQLRYSYHAGRVAKRGLVAILGLRRLKGLRPDAARQLYCAIVTPIIDYASPIWSPTATERIQRLFQPIQRVAAQAIIGAFRTVALPIAEVEASIIPAQVRFKEQRLRFWIDLHTLPSTSPFWLLRGIINRQTKWFISPLSMIATEFRSMQLANMETIYPYGIPPWQEGPIINISDKDSAIKHATILERYDERRIFTDGSVRNGPAGIGVSCLSIVNGHTATNINITCTIGRHEHLNAYFSELAAILDAVELAHTKWLRFGVDLVRRIGVFSDCQSALKSIANPKRQSEQYIIRKILGVLQTLIDERGPRISFH